MIIRFLFVWNLSWIPGMSIKSDIDLQSWNHFFHLLCKAFKPVQWETGVLFGGDSFPFWFVFALVVHHPSSCCLTAPSPPLSLSTPGFHLTPFSSCPRRLFVYWLVCPDDGGPIKDATPDLACVRIREHSADVDEDEWTIEPAALPSLMKYDILWVPAYLQM